MRISESKLVQLIDSDLPKLVILDGDAKIVFTLSEFERLKAAMVYFEPYMHGRAVESLDS